MADHRLTLDLFGAFQAAVGGIPLSGFRSDKARALLAYLAVEGDRPHSRSSLATLLWPDVPDDAALGNLRKTLYRLQGALAPAGEAVLVVDRQAIGVNREACVTDVITFRDLLAETEAHRHTHLYKCDACVERLVRATALYQGELLAGFGLPDAEPFEDWLMLRRERFLQAALGALYRLTTAFLERGEYDLALAHAVRQVELDPGREEAHAQAVRALLLSGQRTQAHAYLGRAQQMLMDTLGLDLSPETLALIDDVDRDVPGAEAPRRTAPRPVLPVQLTPFFGRRRELAEIAAFLDEPACRLVTIVGPGGMGKSRLAIRAAEELSHRFADGVAFLSLGEVRLPLLLPAALLAGLGVQPDGRTDPRTQLLQYLARRECLLVLDGFQHMLERTDLLMDILTAAPAVRVLVTSRLPLGLLAEQRLPLEGLDLPVEFGDEVAREQHIADAGSVRLFVRSARRVDPSFHPTSENAGDLLRISRAVEGMPLALELAASWIRTMSPAAVAEVVERNPGSLTTTAHDVPARQRSIEGVFAQSWELLELDDRRCLAHLSVFGSSFDVGAALAVAGASMVGIASLLARGLLHRAVDGTYRMHGLLRQYAQTAASGVPHLDLDAARARHAAYYLGMVAADDALHGPDPRAGVNTLLPHLAGIQQAWSWAAEAGASDLLAGSLDGLMRFWLLTCEFQVAEALLGQAAGALERRGAVEATAGSEMTSLLVSLLAAQALFLERANRRDEAIEVGEMALQRASGNPHSIEIAVAQSVLGEVLLHRQKFDRAIALLHEAIAVFDERDASRQLALALRRLGTAHWRAGDYDLAVPYLQRAMELVTVLGDVWELARIVAILGGVAYERGDVEGARRETEEALRLYQASGDRRNTAWLQGNLGLVYAGLGQDGRALEYNALNIEASRELGDLFALSVALGNRANLLLGLGRQDEAYAATAEALSVAESINDAWQIARQHAALGRLLHLRGELDPAMAHFEQALPVLRAGGVPYQLVQPLLNLAELQLDRGQIPEAGNLAREVVELASELGLTTELAQAHALTERVSAEAERIGLELSAGVTDVSDPD